jgi:hydroxyacylglutathione hydrolase
MAALHFHQFPYGSDNYGVLVHDPKTGQTAAIDAGDANAYQSALTATGWTLSDIWVTHHHGDHVAGLGALKSATGAQVAGPSVVSTPINGLDAQVGDGDHFEFAGKRVDVIHTPGHTTDMMNFYIADDAVVFTGDTLFALGCGRLFEGTPTMMWESLQKLMALPPVTTVYCSHEYTAANAKFALTIDPDNGALRARAVEIADLRANDEPTVPTTIATELATNPFLRASDAGVRAQLGMQDASDAEVFTEVRKRKDNA